MQPYSAAPQCVPVADAPGPYVAEVDAMRAAADSDAAAIHRAAQRLHARQADLTPDAETFDRLDALADTDPLSLRDVAWRLVRELAEMRRTLRSVQGGALR